MWNCKACSVVVPSRLKLLQHYRLKNRHFGHSSRFPCVYSNCPCTFRTWNALRIHLNRFHVSETRHKQFQNTIFSCNICNCGGLNLEKDYWAHINAHLKKNELITCMFSGCNFKTNICGTFKSHKNRKHHYFSLNDFKSGIVTTATVASQESDFADDVEVEAYYEIESDVHSSNDLPNEIKHNFAAALLKLEHLSHVPSTAIDEFLQELYILNSTLSIPINTDVLADAFQKHNLEVDKSVLKEIATTLSTDNPIHKAIQKGGCLSSAYQRKQYYKTNFNVVDPVEYILDAKNKKTFQYISILDSLQVLLNRQDILDKISQNQKTQETEEDGVYRSFRDGLNFKQNSFLSDQELRLFLGLYVDDFELCNPLGTSRKKHKLCAVYWVLSNLPPGSNSSLSSIYLALLCRTDDVKTYGYNRVLEPLLKDLKSLEEHGIFIPLLGETLKGTVVTVSADNLGAHGLAGFNESFSGHYICRFCTASKQDIQSKEVRTGALSLRTKELHSAHVRLAEDSDTNCFGVRKACPLTEALSHFHVLTGYTPDISHDIFEGIVPVELAHCLTLIISKKYITLDKINKSILEFPYKYSDKTNKPHVLPQQLSSRKTIGGNAHENWSLLRLLPFLIGPQIPEHEPAWQILLDLKEIVELVVAPVHNDESIAYLESKISEHRQRYQELFPEWRLLPKHHYLEHYPQIIRLYGPLVGYWTIRFEAKHSFFKQAIRHTSCFKNVPFSLATKHQLMIGYQLTSPSLEKSELEVSSGSAVPVNILKDEIAQVVRQRYPHLSEIHITKNAWSKGINYRTGMIVVHGSEGGLPEFGQIEQICVLHQKLFFIVKQLCGWYRDHYRAYELSQSPTKAVSLVEVSELTDEYPLADYLIGRVQMVTLKRFVCCKGKK